MELWQEKYRPVELEDYINLEAYGPLIEKWWAPFANYYKSYQEYKLAQSQPVKKRTSKKKQSSIIQQPRKLTETPFLVLYGEPGTGKTTLAHCLFKHYGLDVIEINSSDARSKGLLTTAIDTGKKSVVYEETGGTKDIGIIMDELDGLSSGDVGGASTLVEMTVLSQAEDVAPGYVHAKYPVICTTNSVKEKKLKPILDLAIPIHITTPNPATLLRLAYKINAAEALNLPPAKLELLSRSCPPDFRKLIEYMYQCAIMPDPPAELTKIINTLANTYQIAKFTNLPIQDIIRELITNRPHKTTGLISGTSVPGPCDRITVSTVGYQSIFNYSHARVYYDMLAGLIESDAQVFFLNILDNLAGVIGQLIPARSPGVSMALVIALDNYMSAEPFMTWTHINKGTTSNKDWLLQPYINYIAVQANLTMLNNMYIILTNRPNPANKKKKQPPASQFPISVLYHNRYNGMKSDAGYFNNNMINYEIPKPGMPYNESRCLFNADPELLYMANQAITDKILNVDHIINTPKHTANILKKFKNMMTA